MASSKLTSPAIACAENISLLDLLHSVPILPSRNPVPESLQFQQGYVLSAIEETSLVGHLAFLSNTHNNPKYVPALCVQQNPTASSIGVMLAVNRTGWDDGDSMLLELSC
jgi:hypothetical protein